jgi:hypothetical protein
MDSFTGDLPPQDGRAPRAPLRRWRARGKKTQTAAEARGAGLAARVFAESRAPARVEAQLLATGAVEATEPIDGFAFGTVRPSAGVVAAALANSPALDAALSGADVLALARLGGGGLERLALDAEIEVAIPLVGGAGSVVIGFFEPTLAGRTSLGVSVWLDGDEVFRAKLPGKASLENLVLPLPSAPSESLRISIEMKGRAASSAASLGVVVATQ